MSGERHPYMWICKPHYYFPDFHFYNFPYPFALLFSKGLYALYQKEGASFIPKFEQLLAASGCNSVENIFALMGIDSTDKSFYNNGMELNFRECFLCNGKHITLSCCIKTAPKEAHVFARCCSLLKLLESKRIIHIIIIE